VIAINAVFFAIYFSGKGNDNAIENTILPTNADGTTQAPSVGATMPPVEVTYSKDNLSAGFTNPSVDYRMHAMNHGFGASGASAINISKKYLSQGLGGVVTNVGWNKAYLDAPTAFTSVSASFKAADQVGIKYWLYDEMGYPSGNAGGRTTINNPEFVAKGLVTLTVFGNGNTAASISMPSDVTKIYSAYALDSKGNSYPATVTADKATFAGTDGNWTLYMFCEKKLYEGTHAQTNGWQGQDWLTRDYLNLLDKNAVKKFIDITYGAYASNVPQFKNVVGIFTDEPSLMESYQNNTDVHTYAQISWVDGFADKFQEMHGYDINQKLNFLFEGTSEEAKTVRLNYRQTIGEMVSQNYFKQISDFCVANGTKSSGHLLCEENIVQHVVYYGNLMQCIREEGIPGVDILTGNPVTYMQESSSPYFMAPKYVASAARLAGKSNLVMVEVCPTDTQASDYSKQTVVDALRGTVNLIFFSGVNHINSYVDPASLGKQINNFTDYFGRVSYMTRNSMWNSEIGMYYPIDTVQMNVIPSNTSTLGNANTDNVKYVIDNLTLGLYKKQMDYNLVDDQFIREAQIANGHLMANGISFKVMLMPSVEAIPLDVLQKLVAFQSAGGSVIWVSKTPTMGDTLADHAAVKEMAKGFTAEKITDDLYARIKTFVGDPLKLDGAIDNIYVSKYSTGGAPMYWLLNNNADEKTINVSLDGNYSFDIYDPTTGSITSTGNSTSITLKGYTTEFVVVKAN